MKLNSIKKGLHIGKRWHFNRKINKALFILVGLSPAVVWLYFFLFYPVGKAFIKSFFNWNLAYHTDTFIGLGNYMQMLTDNVFKISLTNTLLAVVYIVPATIFFSLLIAALLNSFTEIVREIFTLVYFLPVITSMVAISAVWTWLYHPSYGLINYFLQTVGFVPLEFLNSPDQALPSVSVVVIWGGIGYFAVILLAAIRNIPPTFNEAAKMDGAGKLTVFWYITMPLLKPTILFCSVMSVIRAFQLFVPIQVMTEGGPGNSTMVLSLYIFRKGVTYLEMGYASSIAVILFLIIMAITIFQWKVLRTDWEY